MSGVTLVIAVLLAPSAAPREDEPQATVRRPLTDEVRAARKNLLSPLRAALRACIGDNKAAKPRCLETYRAKKQEIEARMDDVRKTGLEARRKCRALHGNRADFDKCKGDAWKALVDRTKEVARSSR